MFAIVSEWISTVFMVSILPALIIGVAGILAIRMVLKLVKVALEKSKLEKAAHSLILSLAKVVLYVLLALIVADKLGVDVTGVVALASVLTLAVSLSVQNFLTNIIGGFTLLYTKPFTSGDYVEIAGQAGTVAEIGLTYTKLTTPDNKMISIPNSAVVAAQIVNYSVTGKRRVDINVTASYDAPVEKVLEALKEAANVPTILEEQGIFTAVDTYGDSAIGYILRVWTNTGDYWDTTCQIKRNIKAVFDAQGIEMTYPHLNVHLDK